MQTRHLIVLMSILPLGACSRIEYSIHKKKSTDGTAISQDAAQDAKLYMTWNSMEDYSKHLDELKKEGADALLKIYQEDGRHRVRLGFRRFRDAISRDALTDDSQSPAPWDALQAGECKTVEQTDLFNLGGYGDLRGLIDTAFLAKLSPDHASSFNPFLPQQLDQVTKLAFFEFGIKLDGSSAFVQRAEYSQIQADVDWSVVHEQQDDKAWAAADASSVRFSFKRQLNRNGDQIMVLEALVSPHLQTCGEDEKLPAMSLRYVQRASGAQHLFLKKGYRSISGRWLELKSSRRISLIAGAQLATYTLVDTRRFDLPGESSKSFSIDLAKPEICSVRTRANDLPRSPDEVDTHDGDTPAGDNPQQNSGTASDNPSQNNK